MKKLVLVFLVVFSLNAQSQSEKATNNIVDVVNKNAELLDSLILNMPSGGGSGNECDFCEVSQDLSPTLGGNLDANSKEITNATNIRANQALSALNLTLGATANNKYDLTYRNIAMVVPVFRPNTPNKNIALDIMPNGTVGDNGVNGYAWLDVCDADLITGNPPVNCARVSIRSNFAEFGSKSYNGGVLKDVALTIDSQSALLIKTNYSIIFSKYNSGNFNAVSLNKTASNMSLRLATDGTVLTDISPINTIYAVISSDGNLLASKGNKTPTSLKESIGIYKITCAGMITPIVSISISGINSEITPSYNLVGNDLFIYTDSIDTNFSVNIFW